MREPKQCMKCLRWMANQPAAMIVPPQFNSGELIPIEDVQYLCEDCSPPLFPEDKK